MTSGHGDPVKWLGHGRLGAVVRGGCRLPQGVQVYPKATHRDMTVTPTNKAEEALERRFRVIMRIILNTAS